MMADIEYFSKKCVMKRNQNFEMHVKLFYGRKCVKMNFKKNLKNEAQI